MGMGIGTSFAQTFCLQMTEVSNDGTNLVLDITMSGDAAFALGSSNLQFSGTPGAYGPATFVSSPFGMATGYFTPTVTQPLPDENSFNLELAFPGTGIVIPADPATTLIGQITLPILDPALAANGLTWSYNGMTTETVAFLDDEATQIFATDPTCLEGYVPAVVAAPGSTCAEAIPVADGVTTSPGTLSLASGSATNLCGTTATDAIWYAYTASCDGNATVSSSVDLDQPDTRVSVHSGCDNLDCLAADDDSGEGFTSIATFPTVAGMTYYIEWDDRWDGGEFDFEVTCVPDVAGCTDAAACNFNAAANVDDSSCILPAGCDTCSGETDGTGVVVDNPEVGDVCDDLDANTENDVIGADCSCAGTPLVVVLGCTDAAACNYNVMANTDDMTCVFAHVLLELLALFGTHTQPAVLDLQR